LHIEKTVGSIEAGKDADIVVWSGSPMSTLSRCEQTWIDGRRYFDRDDLAVIEDNCPAGHGFAICGVDVGADDRDGPLLLGTGDFVGGDDIVSRRQN
jgi:hypothetical protein